MKPATPQRSKHRKQPQEHRASGNGSKCDTVTFFDAAANTVDETINTALFPVSYALGSGSTPRRTMSLYAELKRRNVVPVGLAYTVIGWVLAQIAEFAFENFGEINDALDCLEKSIRKR